MTNDDLKRFYNVNDKPEQNKDFVRYGSDGEIISEHDATKDEEVVNYRTLMQHASGGDGGKLYKHCVYFAPPGSNFSSVEFITKSNSTLLYADIALLLHNLGFNNQKICYPIAQTYRRDTDTIKILQGIYSENGSSMNARYIEFSIVDNNLTESMSQYIGYARSSGEITDTVTEL